MEESKTAEEEETKEEETVELPSIKDAVDKMLPSPKDAVDTKPSSNMYGKDEVSKVMSELKQTMI